MLVPLSEWMRSCPLPDRPWLMLGKGPTFGDRARHDLSRFNLLALNHAVREQSVQVAHFIDLEAIAACADILHSKAEWLVAPLHPHVAMQPGDKRLEDYFDAMPVLRDFAQRGRLVWYYHDVVSRPDFRRRHPPGAGPVIRVEAFSAEAALGVLATLGARKVFTLGVDGGIHYARDFHDLNGLTRLANGQESFDRQFIGIHRTAKEFDMDYGPLADPIRVYVGTDETQMAAVQVLEYSIRRFTTRPVEVIPMLDLPVPMPNDPANRPRTGFSFARFLIPKLAGYRGKAIYLDADMLVFGDIADLWDTPMGSHGVLCSRQDTPPVTWQNNLHFQPGRQMSVLLIDCERCRWNIDDIVRGLDENRYDYRKLMCDLCIVPPDEIGESLDPMWNCLEHFEAGRSKLLHYTDMDMQPWRHGHNPLRSIWRTYYRAAVESGAVDPETVERGIARGWLLPELGEALQYAPGRAAEQSPAFRAMAGTPSVRQRSLELESAALRAELGLARLEAEQLRHECHKQMVEHKKVETYAHDLARQIGDLLRGQEQESQRVQEMELRHAAELESLRGKEAESLRTKELYALRVAELESLHNQDQESLRDLERLQYLQALPARVAELETQLGSEVERRCAVEAAVAEQQRQIGDRQDQIGEQQRQIGDQQRQIGEFHHQGARLNAELVECYRQIALREERAADLQRSWSWRIACAMTKPARAVRKLRRRAG